MDPLGDASEEVWRWVKDLSAFLGTALTKPEDLLGQNALALQLFTQTWGLAAYIAMCVAFVLLAMIAMGWRRGSIPFVKAMAIASVVGPAGAIFWTINVALLTIGRKLTEGVGMLGPQSVETDPSAVPFPYIEKGLVPLAVYTIDAVLLALLCLLVVAIVLGQIITGALILPSFALAQAGEFGRTQFQAIRTAWLICFLGGIPVIAFFRRLSQLASNGIENQSAAVAVSYLGIIFGIVATILLFRIGVQAISRIAGGNIDSDVEGHTDTDVDNEVDTNVNNEVETDSPDVSADVDSVDESGGSDKDVDVKEADDSVSTGTLTIGVNDSDKTGDSSSQGDSADHPEPDSNDNESPHDDDTQVDVDVADPDSDTQHKTTKEVNPGESETVKH